MVTQGYKKGHTDFNKSKYL